MVNRVVGLMFLCLLTACSGVKRQYRAVVPDRDVVYLDHEVMPKLNMPSGLALQHPQDFYPVPTGPLPKPGSEPISIVPPGLDKPVEEKTTHD